MRNLADTVKRLLIEYPEARDSDNVLYVKMAELKGCSNVPFNHLMLNLKDYDMPSLESIGRARRKVQEYNPQLQASEPILKIRADQEQVYIDFGRNKYHG